MTTDELIQIGRFALAFSRVNRVTRHEDGLRIETDSDHTVMLGLIACAVAASLPELGLDQGLVAQMVLVHDLPEALVGDTNSFDISEARKLEKKEREAEAVSTMEKLFADTPWLMPMLHRYEAQEEPEARFVRYLDKAMPKITHILNRCAAIRSMGKTKADLVRSHATQLADLNQKYPELASTVGVLLEDLMAASVRAFPAQFWYESMGRLGPSCDDTDSYACLSCSEFLHTRHDPGPRCPSCGFDGDGFPG